MTKPFDPENPFQAEDETVEAPKIPTMQNSKEVAPDENKPSKLNSEVVEPSNVTAPVAPKEQFQVAPQAPIDHEGRSMAAVAPR